jgi:CHASE3 domain sensor protein
MHFALAVLLAGSHVVAPAQIEERLMSASSGREAALSALSDKVQPQARPAVRAIAARLSDAELEDLAARAEMLQTDPVAGGKTTTIILVTVGALIVLFLIAAVACGADEVCSTQK